MRGWVSPSHGRGHRFNPCRAHHQPIEIIDTKFWPAQASAERCMNTRVGVVENPWNMDTVRSRCAVAPLPVDSGDRIADYPPIGRKEVLMQKALASARLTRASSTGRVPGWASDAGRAPAKLSGAARPSRQEI